MARLLYIGVRVEISNRSIRGVGDMDNVQKEYNKNSQVKIFDIQREGRITVNKHDNMITAKGTTDDVNDRGLINFAFMSKLSGKSSSKIELERVVKIINVLGNDRVIRERVDTFTTEASMLNHIPELQSLKQAFLNLNNFIPGFTKIAWYYAPEAKF